MTRINVDLGTKLHRVVKALAAESGLTLEDVVLNALNRMMDEWDVESARSAAEIRRHWDAASKGAP